MSGLPRCLVVCDLQAWNFSLPVSLLHRPLPFVGQSNSSPTWSYHGAHSSPRAFSTSLPRVDEKCACVCSLALPRGRASPTWLLSPLTDPIFNNLGYSPLMLHFVGSLSALDDQRWYIYQWFTIFHPEGRQGAQRQWLCVLVHVAAVALETNWAACWSNVQKLQSIKCTLPCFR